jgi:hypothetical protein
MAIPPPGGYPALRDFSSHHATAGRAMVLSREATRQPQRGMHVPNKAIIDADDRCCKRYHTLSYFLYTTLPTHTGVPASARISLEQDSMLS